MRRKVINRKKAALLAAFGRGEIPEGWCQSLGAFDKFQEVSCIVGIGQEPLGVHLAWADFSPQHTPSRLLVRGTQKQEVVNGFASCLTVGTGGGGDFAYSGEVVVQGDVSSA